MKFHHTIFQGLIYLTISICSASLQAFETTPYTNSPPLSSSNNCCCMDFQLKASYLYWGVKEDYLAFAYILPDNTTIINPKLKTHKREWDSGFRLEALLSNNCYPIGCHFEWTYFKTTSNASAIGDPTNPNISVATASGLIQSDVSPFLEATSVNSSWKININEFAFDLDYTLNYNACVSFCPYLGLFGAAINQKQKILNINATDGFDIGNVTVFRKNDFWGIGPRFGLSANWNFTQQFSLVCDTNLAYLFGKITNKNHFQTSTVPLAVSNLNQKTWCTRPMASAFAALNWNTTIANCSILSLSVGYEFQYWWDQWNASSNIIDDLITADGHWGDLSINGLVASIGISF